MLQFAQGHASVWWCNDSHPVLPLLGRFPSFLPSLAQPHGAHLLSRPYQLLLYSCFAAPVHTSFLTLPTTCNVRNLVEMECCLLPFTWMTLCLFFTTEISWLSMDPDTQWGSTAICRESECRAPLHPVLYCFPQGQLVKFTHSLTFCVAVDLPPYLPTVLSALFLFSCTLLFTFMKYVRMMCAHHLAQTNVLRIFPGPSI